MRSNFITGIATIISKLLLYFFLPLPFVLLGCILFFYDPLNAMPALPFLVFGWGILACSLTVIQLRQKSLIVLFLMIFIVLWHAMAAQLLTERINTFGIIDFQSDDTAYIESATDLANTLKASSKNLSEAWNQVCLGDEIASASLRAHPFTLAYLFCLSENYFNLNYSIAVVINILVLGALYLSICKAALFIHKSVASHNALFSGTPPA